MVKEIIINSSTSQNRVAIIEDGTLVDFFVDHPEKRRMVGDVYLGRIARVLPGIRAAFIDIGMKHDAFLHFSDIGDTLENLQGIIDENDSIEESSFEEKHSDKTASPKRSTPKLHKGQDIIIQIIKEPVENKGVRVSSSISIPGRFCVLLPFDNKIGISKKISDYRERRRLKKMALDMLPTECGMIVRTAARNQSEELLTSDIKYLTNVWSDIQDKIKNRKPPSLVYKDLSTTISVIRDLLTPDVSRVFVDSKKLYKEIKDYLNLIQPEAVEKLSFYKDSSPIFDAFKIEDHIKTLMGRRVHLPSGGHIVIEHTEAMTVIDVNSGRYAAKKEQELNSLKTDLEASRELVRQLRLRDIGGLMVVDFIDLEDDKNRKKIYDELKKEFKKDRAKIAMLPMTEFGIMQITRQRIRENIVQSLSEPCPYCLGTGLLTKKSNLIHELIEWIKRYRTQGKYRSFILTVHPTLGKKLKEGLISIKSQIQLKYLVKLKIVEEESLNPQEIKIESKKTGELLSE